MATDNMNTSYPDRENPSYDSGDTIATVTTALLCIIIPVTIVGNLATIMAFIKVRPLREKPSDLLILALSCADLGTGFALVMLFPVTAIGYWPWGEIGCQIYVWFANICVFSGVIITASISLDRYLLISKDYPKYMKLQSKKRIIIAILVVYVYATSMGFLEVILWNIIPVPGAGKESFDYSRECRSPAKHNFTYAVVLFMVNMFLPMIVIEILSLSFVVLLRRKLKNRAQVGDQDNSQSGNTQESNTATTGRSASDSGDRSTREGSRNRYTKAAITLGALVMALNICLPPFVLYILIISFFCPKCSNGNVRDMLNYLLYFNSCLNPLLYAVTMGKIRRFYKSIICKRS